MNKTYTEAEVKAWFDAMIHRYRNSIAREHLEYVEFSMFSPYSPDTIDEWLKNGQG